jgi:hypothetical protein
LTDKTNNCCGDLPEYFSIECLATCFSDPNESATPGLVSASYAPSSRNAILPGIQAVIIVEMKSSYTWITLPRL